MQAGDGRPSYDELAALIAQQAATIARLQAEVAALRAENAELKRRLGMNSSKPPSSDSPSTEPAPKSLAEHPLAARRDVSLDDLADQPFIALPAAAGPARRFWLAADRWDAPPTVVAEAQTAEETFEAVASGLGVALLAEGNTEIYRRPDVVYRPVPDLSPAELAVIWRTDDDRHPVRVFAETCFRYLCAELRQG